MTERLRQLWPPRDATSAVQLVALFLLALNIVALWFVIRTPGGSPSELRAEEVALRARVINERNVLARTRILATRVESGRSGSEAFMEQYFLDRRTAASTITAELLQDAKDSGITMKDASYPTEPVDGTDNLSLMTIGVNFEGTYADLIHLLDSIDKSSRLYIIESLQAAPQQNSSKLNIGMRLEAFVRESPGSLVAEVSR